MTGIAGFMRLVTVVALMAVGLSVPMAPAIAAEEGLSITKSAVTSPYPADDVPVSNVAGAQSPTFSYSLSYRCTSLEGRTCQNTVITDVLPDELEFVGPVPSGWTVNGQAVTINRGAVTPGNYTLAIPVRFKTQPGAPADATFPTTNTADIAGTLNGAPTTGTSNDVVVIGRVRPVGGAQASKSFSPAQVDEWSGANVTLKLGGTNTGTTVATSLVTTDINPALFDRFDLASVSPQGGAQVQVTLDGTTWVAYTNQTAVRGVRVVGTNVPVGGSATADIVLKLRDTVRGTSDEVVTGPSESVNNQATTDASYEDSSLDRTSMPANATVTVLGQTAAVAEMTKSFAPKSMIQGDTGPVTATIRVRSNGQGGVDTFRIDDPVAGGPSPYGNQLVVDGFDITWPAGASTGAKATISATCGSTTSTTVIDHPQTSASTPCANPSTFSVLFDAPDGSPFNGASTATVVVRSHPSATAAPGAYVNRAGGTVTTPRGEQASTTAQDTFTVREATYAIRTNKSFTRDTTRSRYNRVTLDTTYGGGGTATAPVDKVVIQDPVQVDTDQSDGSAFFDEFDIVSIRNTGCSTGDALLVEYYSKADQAWRQVTAAGANACGKPTPILLSGAERADAEGIRFTYTRTSGVIVVGRRFTPSFDVHYRTTNRDTGAAQDLPVSPQDPKPTARNCSMADAYTTGRVAHAEVAAPCPRITLTPLPTGDGVGISKSVQGLNPDGSAGDASGNEGSRDNLRATYSLSAYEFPADRIVISDPPVTGGSSQAYSEAFASAMNITGVGPITVPPNDRVTIEYLIGGTWTQQARVAAGGTASTVSAAGNPNASAWRVTFDENPNSRGTEPGLESFNYDANINFKVDYQLRDTFRSAVGAHEAGDPVLNRGCYDPARPAGDEPEYADESLSGVPQGSCDLSQSPMSSGSFNGPSNPTDHGWLFNDISAQIILGADVLGTATDGFLGDNVYRVIDGQVNARLAKSFSPASVPVPRPGADAGAQQRSVLTLTGTNTSESVNVDDLEITDTDPDFWNRFDLVSADATPNTARFDVTFDNAADATGLTLAQLNAADVTHITGITAHFADVPPGATRQVRLTVQLRDTVRGSGADNHVVDSYVNDATVRAFDAIENSEESPAAGTISVRDRGRAVNTTKSITPDRGEVDTRPTLDVALTSTNTGELPLDGLITEDDDNLTAASYGTPSVPGTLPTNNSNDFWSNVTFQQVTTLTAPAGAETGRVQYWDGSAWQVATAAAPAPLDVSVVNAALAGKAVKGLRVTWMSTNGADIDTDAVSRVNFQVRLNPDADATKSFTDCAESGLVAGNVTEYQNPACDEFLPLPGDFHVDVDKKFTDTGEDSAAGAAGSPQRFTLTVTNNGTRSLGVGPTAPFTVVDRILAAFDYDVATADPVIDVSDAPNSNLSTSVTPAYDAGDDSLTFAWPEGQVLAPGDTVVIELTLRVRDATEQGTQARNRVGVPMPTNAACTTPDAYVDGECTDTVTLSVIKGASVRATKRSLGDLPNTKGVADANIDCPTDSPVSFPCIAQATAGGTYNWYLDFRNSGNTTIGSPVLIDRLPTYPEDPATTLDRERGSEWRGTPNGPVRVTTDFDLPAGTSAVVEYVTSSEDVEECTAEVDSPSGTRCDAWVRLADGATLPADATAVRVSFSGQGVTMEPGTTVSVTWPEKAPNTLVGYEDIKNGEGQAVPDDRFQQWNSFAYRVPSGDTVYVNEASPHAGVQYATSRLEVSKTVDNNGVIVPTEYFGTFTIDYACTTPDYATTLATGQLGPIGNGETDVLTGLPTGTVCTLTEESDADSFTWAQPDADPAREGYQVKLSGTPGETVRADLTNTFEGRSIMVRKSVVGEPGTPDLDYGFEVECTGKDDEALTLNDGDATFTLKDGETHTIGGLPKGADCTVTESDAQGADRTTYAVGTDAPADGAATDVDNVQGGEAVEFTNTFEASFSLAKAVDNGTIVDDGELGPWDFEVRCDNHDGAGVLTPRTDPVSLKAGETWTWDGAQLLNGATCTATELDPGAGNTVTASGPDGPLTVTDGAIEVTIQDEPADAVYEVAYTNAIADTSLEVEKTVVGKPDVLDGTYGFEVACSYRDVLVPLPAEDASFSLAADEAHLIEGLPVGTTCEVTESRDGGADVITYQVGAGDETKGDQADTGPIDEPQTVEFTNTFNDRGVDDETEEGDDNGNDDDGNDSGVSDSSVSPTSAGVLSSDDGVLPNTGAGKALLAIGLVGLGLLMVGATLMALTRRRREGEA